MRCCWCRRPDDHRRPHDHRSGDRQRGSAWGSGSKTGRRTPNVMTDARSAPVLPQLHVFGRVAPEDKVRLACLMQEAGEVVAMTGDAVNDAAALKQADVGVAMGSGSEVTEQAAQDDPDRRQLRHARERRRPRPRTSTGGSRRTSSCSSRSVVGAAVDAAGPRSSTSTRAFEMEHRNTLMSRTRSGSYCRVLTRRQP